ncbi:signal peptide-containing protein [Theileria equi strain WA]|uniref:Signal peptide-containing protein n=1 Tax=Theileria equi strain WA TaxID=1537102 RepID=L0AYU8_THEEQ|nr:signal peptide-containing protein [Theileria equi strain WA]AFZ80069.1 signal peptide-containing protein [Theileria equi strain WA]|eukprot:XP_004829735.1 signal peptide-containing protein [Theileria equi strain WA]
MRLFSLLYVAFLAGQCICRSLIGGNANVNAVQSGLVESTPVVAETKTVKLDVADVDGNVFSIEESFSGGVPLKTVTPKDGVLISSVMDGGVELWKGLDKEHGQKVMIYYDGESPASVVVNFVKADGTKPWRCYSVQDDGWEVVREEDHEKLLEKLKKKASENVTSPPGTIDINNPDREQCDCFYHLFYATSIKLTVPKKDVAVAKIVRGSETLWTLPSGEKVDHVRAYLNESNEPELILIVTTVSTTMNITYLELKDGKWIPCNNYHGKIANLRKIGTWKANFELDLASTTETTECTIFEVDLLGVTTKHFYPKAEYTAITVKDGGKYVWTHSGSVYTAGNKPSFDGHRYYCRYCIIYKHGDKELLETVVVENSSTRHNYFEKTDTEWKEIKKEDYDKKIEEMTGISTVKISDPATKVQTNSQDSINTALESIKVTEQDSTIESQYTLRPEPKS